MKYFVFFSFGLYIFISHDAAFHKNSFLQGYPVLSPYRNLPSRPTLLLVSCLCLSLLYSCRVYYILLCIYMKLKMDLLEEICNILSLFWHIFPHVMVSTLSFFLTKIIILVFSILDILYVYKIYFCPTISLLKIYPIGNHWGLTNEIRPRVTEHNFSMNFTFIKFIMCNTLFITVLWRKLFLA